MKTIGFFALLCLFWLLLSGLLAPLLLGLGLASVALTVFLAHRMDVIDHESYPLHLSAKLPSYWIYLLGEITRSNIDVIKRILGGGAASISPQIIDIPQSQETVLGAVVYANSITLTPGTVTIELSQDTLTVHALSKETAADLATGAMSAEISKRVFKK